MNKGQYDDQVNKMTNKAMNKLLKLYNREQQINYLELQAKVEFMLLKLTSLQKAESTEYHPDNLDLIVQLPDQENTNLELINQ